MFVFGKWEKDTWRFDTKLAIVLAVLTSSHVWNLKRAIRSEGSGRVPLFFTKHLAPNEMLIKSIIYDRWIEVSIALHLCAYPFPS